MIRVSSITTYPRKKILPIINLIAICICIIFKYIFNLNYKIFDMLILACPFSLLIYLILSRNLKIVYFEEEFLLVDNEKIFFKDLISIEKKDFATYRIYFKSNNKKKSFKFIADSLPFYTPKIIRKIESKIKNK